MTPILNSPYAWSRTPGGFLVRRMKIWHAVLFFLVLFITPLFFFPPLDGILYFLGIGWTFFIFVLRPSTSIQLNETHATVLYAFGLRKKSIRGPIQLKTEINTVGGRLKHRTNKLIAHNENGEDLPLIVIQHAQRTDHFDEIVEAWQQEIT